MVVGSSPATPGSDATPHHACRAPNLRLTKCPTALNDALRGSAEWNHLVAIWDNGIRYLSYEGLLGYLRAKGQVQGKKGGVGSKARQATRELVDAAEVVHKKGLAVWLSSTKK
jgi:hypothetical protein